MDTESRQEQLDLNGARYPAPPIGDRVVAQVLERRWATRAKPLALGPAVARARDAQARDDLRGLDSALIDVAAAALNAVSQLRRLAPALTRRPRR